MTNAARVDFVREAIITFLSDSLDKIAAFIAFVYFANYFTTDAFGAAYTVIGMSMMAASVPKSIGVAISKRVSEDTRRHGRFFLLGVGTIIGYVILATVVVNALMTVTTSQFDYLAAAGLVHLGTRPFLFHVERVYDGVGHTGFAATLDFVDGVLTSILRFVLILGLGFGPEGLLYSGAVSAVLVGVTAYIVQFGVPTTVPKMSAVNEIRTYAGWTILSRVSDQSFHNAAVVLAGTIASPTLASWIKSAETLVMPSNLTVRSVIKSIFVQVSGDFERGSVNITPLQNGVDVAAIIAIPLLAGSAVFGNELMRIVYGSGYGGSGHVLVAVAAVYIFKSQAKIFTSILMGANHPDASAIVNIVFALLAGTLFGIALYFNAIAVFLILFVTLYAGWAVTVFWMVDRRVIDTSGLSWRFVVEQAFSAFVMVAVVGTIGSRVSIESWLHLGGLIVLGGIMYSLVLFLVSSQARQMFQTVSERVVGFNT